MRWLGCSPRQDKWKPYDEMNLCMELIEEYNYAQKNKLEEKLTDQNGNIDDIGCEVGALKKMVIRDIEQIKCTMGAVILDQAAQIENFANEIRESTRGITEDVANIRKSLSVELLVSSMKSACDSSVTICL